MTDQSSWRSPSTAEHYEVHDFGDFAQEFLRRNSDYQSEWAHAEMRATENIDCADKAKEGLAGRWGLCFPLRAGCKAERKSGFVVARGHAQRRDARKPVSAMGVHAATRRENIGRPQHRWRTALGARIRYSADPFVYSPNCHPQCSDNGRYIGCPCIKAARCVCCR